ncbi:LpxI family protein [Pararhizobium haloflavum]|uniref:LpxI family protein n=1 Tax=Pararhizobium haloflavum TaxID=2037914 RepID=UPI000C17A402|nr:UDP-2,3-diacylglucosamine diphosphatase LpxI [Pararhizobium haloflavum]
MARDSSFEGAGRLAILAGGGQLPLHVAEAARKNGENPFIIALSAEADLNWRDFDSAAIGTGDFSSLEALLRQHGIDRVVLSGGVRRRPEWREIRPTWKTVLGMPRVIGTLLRSGDDTVLRMVIELIEGTGARVIGAQEIAPDLLAETGSLTKRLPRAEDRRDIEAGSAAALALGSLDVGQAAVAVGGRVIALEGAEGTDAMLQRVAALRRDGRISQKRQGVLVKFCKPQQDVRADLPSIGPGTIEALSVAGLAGVAVEAGRSLILERALTIDSADRADVFVAGIERDEALCR